MRTRKSFKNQITISAKIGEMSIPIEYVGMPQFSKDYYGPNMALRAALTESGNTWRMVHREAIKFSLLYSLPK